MSLPKSVFAIGFLAGLAGLTPQARAIEPVPLSGQILGEVRSAAGIAQMGAKVTLLNRFDQVVREAMSDSSGKFLFDRLTPGAYSVRVALASFVPVLRRNIAVLAGSQQLLEVSLTTLFSSIQLVPASEARATLMGADWAVVLRSSPSTRPVLRLVEGVKVPEHKSVASMFSDTNGVLRLSAGDSNLFNGSMQQALGTGFAVETSVRGRTQVRLAGNFGYSAVSGLPSAGFRTTYARERDGQPGPEISLTVRQIYFPASIGNSGGNGPVLRTASLSSIDELNILDVVRLEYGFDADSIALFGRMNFFSPFARATYDLGDRGELKLAASAGSQPASLLNRTAGGDGPSEDLAALGLLPRLTRRSDRAAVERTNTYEIGYSLETETRTFIATVYRDAVTNGAFLMSGAIDLVGAGDLLPDLNTRGYVVNLGDYQRTGFSAAMTQTVGDHIELTAAAGRSGALIAEQGTIVAGDGEGLREQIRQAQRSWVTLQASSSIPVTETELAASYGWSDFRALTPVHVSLTNRTSQQLGWNVWGRQPLPAMGGIRMELNAELRNLLAQGYLRVASPEGRRAVITNSPRAVRGGLSFIF